MKIFLGKIPGVQGINQLSEHFYQAEEEWFNGIDIGDYAFVVGEGKIRLWKAISWGESSDPDRYKRLDFEEIIPNTGMKTNHLAAFIHFKLSIDLIVKSRRSTAKERKAFFFIEHDAEKLLEEDLINSETYVIASNFREVVLLEDLSQAQQDSFDLQFYKEEEEYKYIPPVFCSDLGEFKDSTFKLGRGSIGKDRTIQKIQGQKSNRWTATELSIQDFYDLFFCAYREKINYYILGSKYGENADEDVFNDMYEKGVISTGFAWHEDLSHLLGKNQGDIINYLKNKGYDTKAYSCLKYFLNISVGDKIAVKADGSPKGTQGFLSIRGIAEVVDQVEYSFQDEKLGHIIKVEWIQAPIYKEFSYGGYGRTIHQLKTKDDEDKINEIFYQDYETIEAEEEPTTEEPQSTKINTTPLNQILFGPPGTGKTYHTINHALSIIANVRLDTIKTIEENSNIEESILAARDSFKDVVINKEDCKNGRDVIRAIYSSYKKKEQICFTTFHQSMSYEDFVEGIKPLKPEDKKDPVQYDIEKGIFRHISELAESNFENSKKKNRDKPVFELVFEQFKSDWEAKPDMKFSLRSDGYDFTIYEISETSIMFENSSGGRSHTLSISTLKDLYYGKKKIKALHGIWIYYPSILAKLESYHSHVNQINKLKNYVLIIDEINRGNVSEILGELITLLEEDKRLGNKEDLEVKLPYSKRDFGVPPNLYILGTMNTADRSVEALDSALRRRFSFIEMPPKAELIEQEVIPKIDLQEVLKQINKRLNKLLTKDHLIGHSYFMNLENEDGLKAAFRNKIIPLLQEYFYGDFGKIGMVLGAGFIEKENEDVEFAAFEYNSGGGYESRDTYKILDIDADFDVIGAIDLLMNKKSSDNDGE